MYMISRMVSVTCVLGLSNRYASRHVIYRPCGGQDVRYLTRFVSGAAEVWLNHECRDDQQWFIFFSHLSPISLSCFLTFIYPIITTYHQTHAWPHIHLGEANGLRAASRNPNDRYPLQPTFRPMKLNSSTTSMESLVNLLQKLRIFLRAAEEAEGV